MTDSWRATLFLSVYFFTFGVQLPYLPTWLENARGLSGAQISMVLFGALVARVVTGPVLGAWADGFTGRAATWRLSLAGVAGFGAISLAQSPLALILIGFVAITMTYGVGPIAEAMLLEASTKSKPSFGLGRAIASSSFVGGVLLGGVVVDVSGPELIAPTVTVLFGVIFLVSLITPTTPLGTLGGDITFRQRLEKGAVIFKRPTLLFLLLSTGPIQASHAFYYGFSVVIWEKQGFSGGVIGALWATGIVLEVLLLTFSSRLPTWVTPQRLVLFGAIGGVVRWGGMGFLPEAPAAFALQLLHGFSFAATYLGMIKIIYRDVPSSDRTVTMSLQSALVGGAFTGASGLMAGLLYDRFSVQGYWAMAVLSAVGLTFALLLMLRVATRAPKVID